MKKIIFAIAVILIIFTIFVLPFILIETILKDWFCNEAISRGEVIKIFEINDKKFEVYLMPQCLEYIK